MFSRMLKLPEACASATTRVSLQIAVHAAAPCPCQVKEQMIEWWGPIIHEYYGATEGLGFTACNTAEWLRTRGTVGKVLLGELHVLDENRQPPRRRARRAVVQDASPFVYFNDPERTQASRSADGTMTTVGDVGYLDDDGFLLPHRPLHLHDHLGRRQHLPAGVREPADHAPAGGRRRRVRRAQRRPRRRGQGGGAAAARREGRRRVRARADRALPSTTWRT
jgi:acyl-CoA synthetase (AMP-forming)/AMP-acid ligase II